MSSLLDPLPLPCGVTLPNRVALAPMTNQQSNPDGTLHDDELRWLVRRAGFGLLLTCAAFVSDEGCAWEGQLGIARAAHLPGLARLAAALRAAGTAPLVQLYHGGKQATRAPEKLSTTDGDGIRGATHDDLARVVADFVAAARRAEAAGFSGVELHGANGYLFTQFLAPADNPRTDAYGGGLAGRARLLREALQAVRAAVSPGFAVGVRISPVDVWSTRGLRLADSVQLSQWLAEDGADYIHLSLTDASGAPPHEDTDVPVARAIRDALPAAVPVVAAGGIWTPADAQRAVDAGVDVIALGRAAIGTPSWPQAVLAEGGAASRPPWSPDQLRARSVGESLVAYLRRFPGLVTDGRPPREA